MKNMKVDRSTDLLRKLHNILTIPRLTIFDTCFKNPHLDCDKPKMIQ